MHLESRKIAKSESKQGRKRMALQRVEMYCNIGRNRTSRARSRQTTTMKRDCKWTCQAIVVREGPGMGK